MSQRDCRPTTPRIWCSSGPIWCLLNQARQDWWCSSSCCIWCRGMSHFVDYRIDLKNESLPKSDHFDRSLPWRLMFQLQNLFWVGRVSKLFHRALDPRICASISPPHDHLHVWEGILADRGGTAIWVISSLAHIWSPGWLDGPCYPLPSQPYPLQHGQAGRNYYDKNDKLPSLSRSGNP